MSVRWTVCIDCLHISGDVNEFTSLKTISRQTKITKKALTLLLIFPLINSVLSGVLFLI